MLGWLREGLARLRARPGFQAAARPVRVLAREWTDKRIGGLAAEVAFWATLSAVPLLLAVAAALGFLDVVVSPDSADRARDQVADWLGSAFGTSSAVSEGVDELFDRTSPGLLSVSLLVLLWAASRAFGALIRALDVVYGLTERRSWLSVRLTGLALAVGTVVVSALAVAAIVVGPFLGKGSGLAEALGLSDTLGTVWAWVRIPLVIVVLIAWATTVFHFGPRRHGRWRADLPGAIASAALWLVGYVGLLVYLNLVSGSANAVFGVLGGALSLLLWLYVLALGTLLGAVLNAQLQRRDRSPAAVPPAAPAGLGCTEEPTQQPEDEETESNPPEDL